MLKKKCMTAPQDPRGRPLRAEGAPWVVFFRHGVETPVASAAPVPTSAPSPEGPALRHTPTIWPVSSTAGGGPCGGPHTHTHGGGAAPGR